MKKILEIEDCRSFLTVTTGSINIILFKYIKTREDQHNLSFKRTPELFLKCWCLSKTLRYQNEPNLEKIIEE